MADLKKVLKDEKIQSLGLRAPLCVSGSESVEKTLSKMREMRTGCVLITKDKKLLGIFTDRDALTRLIEQKANLKDPIEKYMTPSPKVLQGGTSVADAIRLMNEGGYRHLPILGEAGEVWGLVSVRDIVKYLADHFPYEIYNLPPDPRQVISAPEGA